MDPLRVYDYLTTARAQVFDWIRPLSPGQYTETHPIGLGSLARTLHHVMAAEHRYVERLRGVLGPLDAPAPEHDPDIATANALPFDVLEPTWRRQSVRTRDDLVRIVDWTTPRRYTTWWEGRSASYVASAADFFAQLAFHEVHHRTQALHMLRRLGVAVGDVDYNTLMWTLDPED